ncbi:MAG: carbon-nitrogen hydrolase family protein [Spongiibacteraceae bacterium]|nr:carbon-nitrogen hydrolase family protein [Spongiibacteraceae bacterium]
MAAQQMVSGADLDANLDSAARLLRRAARDGAELAVLPEMFALFGVPPATQTALGRAERDPEGRVRRFLHDQARALGLWLVGGTLPIAAPQAAGRSHAACLVVDPAGQLRGRYDKLHLFDVEVADGQGQYRESDTFAAGDLPAAGPATVNTPLGRLGLAVCYDIRFPELFGALARRGADLYAVPAAFTRVTGNAHWLPLLRARAIETQSLVIGANQGGIHSTTRQTSGGSVIIDAWGRVLAEAGYGETCLVATVDMGEQRQIRRRMPVAAHRRESLTSDARR